VAPMMARTSGPPSARGASQGGGGGQARQARQGRGGG
jgi:hypothetical protein